MAVKHKVWIELPKPINEADAEEICAKANRMMARLGNTSGNQFFRMQLHGSMKYCWGGDMGYSELPDGGHSFSLDYLGREEPDVIKSNVKARSFA
jgi:hypothetical protein